MHVFGKNNGLNATRVKTLGKVVELADLHDLQIAKTSAAMYFVKAINGKKKYDFLILKTLNFNLMISR